MVKKLLMIPIVHSEKEMGSLRSDISEIIDRKFGKERRDKHRQDVELFWDSMQDLVTDLLAHRGITVIRIYQDGMPIGGEIGTSLVEAGAKDGSPNYRIVLTMIQAGCILEKTESPVLLKEEYEIIKAIVNAKTDRERELQSEKHKHRLYELTIERDRYIASRISESLKEGEFGILFIGATHNVAPYIPPDIDYRVCNFVKDDVIAYFTGTGTVTGSAQGKGSQ